MAAESGCNCGTELSKLPELFLETTVSIPAVRTTDDRVSGINLFESAHVWYRIDIDRSYPLKHPVFLSAASVEIYLLNTAFLI